MQNRTEKAFIALCKALIMAVPFHFTQKQRLLNRKYDFRHIPFCVLIFV